MVKELVNLGLRDMYAIKHALQNVVREKRNRLEVICTEEIDKHYDSELENEIRRLDKDINHEEVLIKTFDNEIASFKEKHGPRRQQ